MNSSNINKPKFTVFTIFPELFPGTLKASVIGRALENNLWDLEVINIRDYAKDKHKTIDDTPYGGGSGMVLLAEVLDCALNDKYKSPDKIYNYKSDLCFEDKPYVIYLSPRGRKFDNSCAFEFKDFMCKNSKNREIALICGRFEGIDQRVLDFWNIEEISIGDYILAGGEIAAQVIIESTVRLLPGVLGNYRSIENESFNNENGLLEHNHYTKPNIWKNIEVPEVLLNGNHKEIDKWREKNSREVTKKHRPDLLSKNEN